MGWKEYWPALDVCIEQHRMYNSPYSDFYAGWLTAKLSDGTYISRATYDLEGKNNCEHPDGNGSCRIPIDDIGEGDDHALAMMVYCYYMGFPWSGAEPWSSDRAAKDTTYLHDQAIWATPYTWTTDCTPEDMYKPEQDISVCSRFEKTSNTGKEYLGFVHCKDAPYYEEVETKEEGCKCWANGAENEDFCESGELKYVSDCLLNDDRCHWGPSEIEQCAAEADAWYASHSTMTTTETITVTVETEWAYNLLTESDPLPSGCPDTLYPGQLMLGSREDAQCLCSKNGKH